MDHKSNSLIEKLHNSIHSVVKTPSFGFNNIANTSIINKMSNKDGKENFVKDTEYYPEVNESKIKTMKGFSTKNNYNLQKLIHPYSLAFHKKKFEHIEKQHKTIDEMLSEFSSDEENTTNKISYFALNKNEAKLVFIKSHKYIDSKVESVIDIKSLVNSFYSFPNLKIQYYQCKFCKKSFNSKQALGGHCGKTHPNQSEDYKHRKDIYKIRANERKRRNFVRSTT